MAAEVVVFTRPSCTYCQKAKDLLMTKVAKTDLSNLAIFQIILDEQVNYDQARNEMIRLAGGKTTVPQIIINGQFIPGGFTGLKELDDKGILENMLQQTTTTTNLGEVENNPSKFVNHLNLKMARIMRIQELDF
jgi:glutaredoxin 3